MDSQVPILEMLTDLPDLLDHQYLYPPPVGGSSSLNFQKIVVVAWLPRTMSRIKQAIWGRLCCQKMCSYLY